MNWFYQSVQLSLRILQLHFSDLVHVEVDVDSVMWPRSPGWEDYWIRQTPRHLKINLVVSPWYDNEWSTPDMVASAIMLVNYCQELEELVLTAPRLKESHIGAAKVTAKITKVQAPWELLVCFNNPSCQLEELSIPTPFKQVGALRKLRVQMGENEFNESNRLTRLVEEIVGLEEIEADWVDGQEIINNLTFKSNISILKYNELDVRTANPDLLRSKIEENQDGISLEQFWLNGYVIWRRHQE
ncbi:hypothetical protein C8R42DRAFT_644785 [Lentinula raphanica]|nr:hypothetical protein C8R42DRAFT_644785 [Lentinula raphanica]